MRGVLSRYVPAGERVVLWVRPSPLFVVLRPLWLLVLIAASWGLVEIAATWADAPLLKTRATWWAAGLVAAVLLWQVLEWMSRLYVLTERRLIAVAGVLFQSVSDVPLRNVRNVAVARGLMERLTGLGTMGAATAGTGGFELAWVYMSRPDELLRTVRAAVDAASEGRPVGVAAVMGPTKRPLVVGLTGGIGAGKSEVAGLLAGHGYVVIDSDKEAKAVLDRPEVRGELVKWWGPKVLTPQGTVDRRAVAGVVFSDEKERLRLEALVHPLVKSGRAELVDRAAQRGASGVVVDAPLLLEAGSDRECDVVVFVDSPREQRLARVRASRGWDEAELARREKAQLSVEEKRRRSDEVVVNDSTPQVLRQRVSELVVKLATKAAGPR